MTSTNFKSIDLLRKRREGNFLQEPFFIDTRKYINKGIYIGLSIISLSLLFGFVFIIRSNIIQRKIADIKPLVEKYDALQKKLDQESKDLKTIASFNNKLKNSIVNLSSSSALLAEVSSILPRSIQLIYLDSSSSILSLKSKVPEGKTFNLINGFLISLDDSEFINFSDIDLGNIQAVDKIKGESEGHYIVDITTKITSDFEEINQKYLKKLGSEGLSNRIDLLKNVDKN
ncbi:hypothetical protein [Prochlorococcus marinus]|uniref:Tfp pilus assembly protein PilN n=1 Tax=Prochlorococcus marinus str. GP2 TaxID=59925 RepID=A0A0A1ZLG5_PROMR|nr:hypothetical protein [Prochlorococcus marinus]KGF89049.1 hypothetical protein EU91_0163 [Prochlorococcus marinus str. GP2]